MKLRTRHHGSAVQVIVQRKLDKPNNSGLSTIRQIIAEFHGGEEAEERAQWFVEQMRRES